MVIKSESASSIGGMNKRGQNITLGTIILIILGVVVMVILIFGFTTGWGKLWERLTGTAGNSNVDTVVTACNLACNTENKYGYCREVKNVKLGGGKNLVGSCENFEGEIAGLSACGSFECLDGETYKQKCSDLGGEWKALPLPCTAGSEVDKTNEVGNKEDNSGLCCVPV